MPLSYLVGRWRGVRWHETVLKPATLAQLECGLLAQKLPSITSLVSPTFCLWSSALLTPGPQKVAYGGGECIPQAKECSPISYTVFCFQSSFLWDMEWVLSSCLECHQQKRWNINIVIVVIIMLAWFLVKSREKFINSLEPEIQNNHNTWTNFLILPVN